MAPLPELDWQLDDYLRAFRLHVKIILITAAFTGGVTAVHMSRKPNLYRATARILIEIQTPQVVKFQEVTPFYGGWIPGFLQTEFRIITSPTVLGRVVEELHLAGFPPFSRVEDPAALLQNMVQAEIVRGTKLVDISATSTKPELAARIANSVAENYAYLNLERRQEMTIGGAEWLRSEVGKMEENLRVSQQALQNFRDQHGTVDFGEEQQNTLMQRLRELTTAVTDAKKQRIEAETKYREKHPILLELKSKERELQEALLEQEQGALELNRLSVQYSTLLRELKTSESIHSALLTRLKELSVQEGIQSNNVRVVSAAKAPRKPFAPLRARTVAMGIFLGFIFGSGFAFLLEALAKTIRTRREFEQILEIPFLGHVPMIQLEKSRRGNESLLLLMEPQSTPAEAIRAIRTIVEFLLPSGQPHALLITSSLPEEGKSLVSLNLAIALQELGRKVILIDGDMRRPSIHRLLNLSLEPGLSAYLQGQASKEELVQPAVTARELPVIPAGMTPTQPTDLLVHSRMQELVETLRKEYQYILIDTPPVLAVADATAVASLVEGVICVIRSGRTHRDAALAGKQRLVDVGSRIIGGVLNGTQPKTERGYQYYYYYRSKERRRKGLPLTEPPLQETSSSQPPLSSPP